MSDVAYYTTSLRALPGLADLDVSIDDIWDDIWTCCYHRRKTVDCSVLRTVANIVNRSNSCDNSRHLYYCSCIVEAHISVISVEQVILVDKMFTVKCPCYRLLLHSIVAQKCASSVFSLDSSFCSAFVCSSQITVRVLWDICIIQYLYWSRVLKLSYLEIWGLKLILWTSWILLLRCKLINSGLVMWRIL